jgi:dihydrofolate reductase
MYEVMRYWETDAATRGRPPGERDYAQIWRSADKIVFSRTLRSVSSARTRIERDFDAAAIRHEKARAGGDIGVGGPGLAARALEAGLVDELRLFVVPILVGAARSPCPMTCALRSNCWTSGVSTAAWPASTTASSEATMRTRGHRGSRTALAASLRANRVRGAPASSHCDQESGFESPKSGLRGAQSGLKAGVEGAFQQADPFRALR